MHVVVMRRGSAVAGGWTRHREYNAPNVEKVPAERECNARLTPKTRMDGARYQPYWLLQTARRTLPIRSSNSNGLCTISQPRRVNSGP